MKNKGFTLIELLAVIAVLGMILAIAVPSITGILKNAAKDVFAKDAEAILRALTTEKLKDNTFNPTFVTKEQLKTYLTTDISNYQTLSITYNTDDELYIEIVGANKYEGLFVYGTIGNMVAVENDTTAPTVATAIITNTTADSITVQGSGADEESGISKYAFSKDNGVTWTAAQTSDTHTFTGLPNGTYQIKVKVYNQSGLSLESIMANPEIHLDYSISTGVNAPQLATGMTPIKWVSGVETVTTASDPDWYDYTNKLWANAKTQDGSYWVWIPRYAYTMGSAYHTGTAGTIGIKFLTDTSNAASDATPIVAYSNGNSATSYVPHPAFTFGSTEVTGIWVSKFEASNSGGKVASKPNATSWTNINVATMFNNSRSMEIDSTYGWGTSGTNLDTHMMKNTEWGAVAYLSRSAYGKNGEIWINNINADLTTGYGPSITGCAGSSVSAGMVRSATCPAGNTYETAMGINASTSGNITGVYDMSGGAWEYVMGNLDNLPASSGLTMSNIQDKYINKYSSSNNYGYNNSTYGDAYYETSSGAYLNNASGPTTAGWHSDYTYAPYSAGPWFSRGGGYGDGAPAGAFSFARSYGGASTNVSFRSVVLVAPGL